MAASSRKRELSKEKPTGQTVAQKPSDAKDKKPSTHHSKKVIGISSSPFKITPKLLFIERFFIPFLLRKKPKSHCLSMV